MGFLSIDPSVFCSEDGLLGLIEIAGWVLFVFKIAIPLLIVGFGVMDFGKAVVAEKEDEIKKQTKRLIFRIVAGIAIFLLPNIILWVFKIFVSNYEEDAADFKRCEDCFLKRDCD